MPPHVCPWWGGYFIDNRFRRLLHDPQAILAPHVQPGDSALDFGCGMGFFSIGLARIVGNPGSVIAVDLQQQMLDVLEKRARKAGVADRIRTHRCEVDALGLKAEVDFVLAFYSAHEVPDPRRLLRELSESLRGDGRLLLVEPIGHVTKKQFRELLTLADEFQLQLESRPRVRLSHAALLRKV